MSKPINIRLYKNGDAEKIYHFIDKHTSHKRNASFWVWINRLLPETSADIFVAEYNGEIVGHYAVLPFKFNYQKKQLQGGLGIHALIHPDFRRDVSIFQITNRVYQYYKEKGADFIFGFPNPDYRLIQEKIEKWEKVKLFHSYRLDINSFQPVEINQLEIEVISFENFGINNIAYNISDLLERSVELSNYLRIKKDLRYYIIRYLLHPYGIYTTCWIKKDGKIEGWLVFKKHHDNKSKTIKGHLIDFVVSSSATYSDVLKVVKKYFKAYDKINMISIWPTNEMFKEELIKGGFSNDGFETYLGVKFLKNSLNESIKKDILDFKKWHLPMGDSDAF